MGDTRMTNMKPPTQTWAEGCGISGKVEGKGSGKQIQKHKSRKAKTKKKRTESVHGLEGLVMTEGQLAEVLPTNDPFHVLRR